MSPTSGLAATLTALHHGAFFEPSRQRLSKRGLVLLDVPSTAERIGPAAAALIQLVTSAALIHDGDDELARQMARVVARPTPKGWSVASGSAEGRGPWSGGN